MKSEINLMRMPVYPSFPLNHYYPAYPPNPSYPVCPAYPPNPSNLVCVAALSCTAGEYFAKGRSTQFSLKNLLDVEIKIAKSINFIENIFQIG
jgi:hypothetical protein